MLDTLLHRYLNIPYRLATTISGDRQAASTIVFIHGIGHQQSAWDKIIDAMPSGVRIVTVDLLGFGASPKPTWAKYNAVTQARAVQKTLLQEGIFGKVHLIGHSLGALVAIEMAKRYPLLISRVSLCSPPLYQPDDGTPRPDKMLRKIFKKAVEFRNEFLQLSEFVSKHQLVNPSFSVNQDNIDAYLATLQAMIINQQSLETIRRLRLPMKLYFGAFDPLVVPANLTELAKSRKNINLVVVPGAHEITGLYRQILVSDLKKQYRPTEDTK